MNSSQISFSVVTVCFNSAQTIAKALQSVASQNWPSFEHIVIDGGSSDGTMEVVDRFAAGLSHIVSERDRGIYDAMNKGVALATGDVICFLNSDDAYAHADVLRKVGELFERTGAEAVFGDVAFFKPGDSSRVVRRYDSSAFTPARLAYGVMPAHPALFIKREIFARVGPFRDDYVIAGDFEFIARAFSQPLRYEYLNEVLVNMQLGGISTAGWRSRLTLNRELARACRENGIRTNFLKLLARYPAKLMELRWR